jgi:hypothetical protein
MTKTKNLSKIKLEGTTADARWLVECKGDIVLNYLGVEDDILSGTTIFDNLCYFNGSLENLADHILQDRDARETWTRDDLIYMFKEIKINL